MAGTRGPSAASVGEPETDLRGTILSGDLLQILRTVFDRVDRPVRRVEHVEDLGDPFEAHAARKRDRLLDPEIGLAPGRLHEPVAWHDRPVWTRPQPARRLAAADARDD